MSVLREILQKNYSVRRTKQNRLILVSNCAICNKNESRFIKTQKFKEIGDLNHVYKNELDKACFAEDAAYANRKDVTIRTASE